MRPFRIPEYHLSRFVRDRLCSISRLSVANTSDCLFVWFPRDSQKRLGLASQISLRQHSLSTRTRSPEVQVSDVGSIPIARSIGRQSSHLTRTWQTIEWLGEKIP